MCEVVHVSFRLVHGVQPSGPEFHKHRRLRFRQRSHAYSFVSTCMLGKILIRSKVCKLGASGRGWCGAGRIDSTRTVAAEPRFSTAPAELKLRTAPEDIAQQYLKCVEWLRERGAKGVRQG